MIEFLKDILERQYGEEITKNIIDGFSSKRYTTLRINRLKSNVEDIKSSLLKMGIKYREVPFYNEALIIENADETDIKRLGMYEKGEIYLQSLSSMIPPLVVEPCNNETILDMAAAPGGKTTELFSLSDGKAMITACEKNKIRAERLKYNLEKQGATKVTVMVQDARRLDDFFSFDKILLDAPCSGSGTITLDTKDFSKELIDRSIKTQKELIKKAVKILKVNGELVYSTCSILREENEEVLKEILKNKCMEIVPIDSLEYEGVPLLPTTIAGTICVCPNELYEGFFVAKLRKIR